MIGAVLLWAEHSLRYTIPVISNGKMVFKLMEAHLHRLCPVVEEGSIDVPWLAAGNAFQRLRLFQCSLVASSSP